MCPSLQERLALATVNSKCSFYLPESTRRYGKHTANGSTDSGPGLLLHAEKCMRHEDVVRKILLSGFDCTLDAWLCDSFAELIKEMELWKWADATGDFWSRLAKAL